MATNLWLLALLAPVTLSSSSSILAGRWSVTNQMEEASFDGRKDDSMFPLAKPELICLGEKEAANGPGLAFVDESMCEVTSRSVTDTRFAFNTICQATESEDKIATETSGQFAPDHYSATTVSIQDHDGHHVVMRSRVTAKRIGAC